MLNCHTSDHLQVCAANTAQAAVPFVLQYNSKSLDQRGEVKKREESVLRYASNDNASKTVHYIHVASFHAAVDKNFDNREQKGGSTRSYYHIM